MNKDKLNQLIDTITRGYQAIDEIKYLISKDLVTLEKKWKSQSSLLTIKKSTPTFQHFLIEYLAKTYAQVIPVLRVGQYITKQEISIWNITKIPINKMELVAKSGLDWTEDIKYMALTNGFTDLKDNLKELVNEKKK